MMSATPYRSQDHPHLLWAEIDLAAVGQNIRELKRIIRPSARLLAAVKANGYGHGAEQVARTVLNNGATDLGVARIEEGLALRRAGITAPILIFGYTPAAYAPQLLTHQLVPTVFSMENACALASAAKASGQRLPIHIKVDTGMGRLGLPCDGLPLGGTGPIADEIVKISALDGLALKGLYTHFATADHADKSYAREQFDCFRQLLAQLEAAGCVVGLRHAANSGAILEMPETHLDMVRPGITVYGLYPSAEVSRDRIDLKPAMILKSIVIHTKKVPAGTCVSYGCTYKTSAPTVIATIPVGYADGYNRRLSNRGHMLVGGHRVPIVGRVCMDLTMIDVGAIPKVNTGDEVVLIGRQGDETITADEIAATLGTINYEVVSALTERVPRVYVNEDER